MGRVLVLLGVIVGVSVAMHMYMRTARAVLMMSSLYPDRLFSLHFASHDERSLRPDPLTPFLTCP